MLEWIDAELWQAFKDMRKQMRAPLTPYAEKLIIRELVKLKTAGEDPQACLEQSVMLGWRDVYPLREKRISTVKTAVEETKQMLEAEARRKLEGPSPEVLAKIRAMGSIKRVA